MVSLLFVVVASIVVGAFVSAVQAQAQIDLTVEVECITDDGIVRVTAENYTGAERVLTMDLEPTDVPARTVVLPNGASHVESWSARPDGEHVAIASYQIGTDVYTSQALTDVNCDGGDSWFNSGICLVAAIWCDIAGIDPASLLSDLAGGTISSLIDGWRDMVVGFGVKMLLFGVSWWALVPPVVVTTGTPTVAAISGNFIWLGATVAVAGVLWQSIRMVLQNDDAPSEIVKGLMTVMVATSIAWPATQGLAIASHQWSLSYIQTTIGDPTLQDRLEIAFLLISPIAAMTFGFIASAVGLFHLALNVVRDVLVIVLAGLIPFAAAGRFFVFGKYWLPKIIGRMAAIILAKPLAAAALATGLQVIANGTNLITIATGFLWLMVSVLVPFFLVKVFDFAEGLTSSSGGGGGSALVGAAGYQLATRNLGGRAGGGGGVGQGTPSPTTNTATRNSTGPAVRMQGSNPGATPAPKAPTGGAAGGTGAAGGAGGAAGGTGAAGGAGGAAGGAAGGVGAAVTAGKAAVATARNVADQSLADPRASS